jgi:hypothetical protein
LSSSSSWAANTRATLASLRAALGEGPCIVTRCCATVPTDLEYPGWEAVRADQLSVAADPDNVGVQAPDGPWREAYKLHLDGPANLALANLYLGAL